MKISSLNRVILFISVLILKAQPLYAQFEFGFRTETEIVMHKNINGDNASTTSGYPSCLQLTFGYFPLKDILTEIRIGNEFGMLDLGNVYYGFECGIYGKYFPAKSLYLTAGLAFHSNDAESISNYYSRRSGSLLMPAFGLGVKPWTHVGFEGLYQLAGNQAISATKGMKYISSILKVGVVCSW